MLSDEFDVVVVDRSSLFCLEDLDTRCFFPADIPKAGSEFCEEPCISLDPVCCSVFVCFLFCPGECATSLHVGKDDGNFRLVSVVVECKEEVALVDEGFKLIRLAIV